MTGNPYLWLAAAIGLLAAGLLIMGIRGRPVPPRRVCRRCRYEVAEQTVCPECGRDLGGRGGARVVRRRPRRGLVWSGLGVAAALVVVAGTLAILVARGINLNAYKPFEVLLWEVSIGDARTAGAAADELWKRRMSLFHPMSDERADRVLAAALRLHADTDRPWPGMLSGFIDEAMFAGRMTPEQAQRYFDNIASPRLLLPEGEPPRAGAPILLNLDHGWRAGRFGAGRMMAIGLTVSIELEEPDGAQYRLRGLNGLPQMRGPVAGAVHVDIPADAEQVRVAGIARYEPQVADLMQRYPEIAPYAETKPVEWPVELVFDVAPAPDIEIAFDNSAEMRAAMLEQIRPQLSRTGDSVLILFERRSLPAALYGTVSIRDPESGQEWQTGAPFMTESAIGTHGLAASVPGLTAETVDLIIRPQPESLRHTLLQRRTDASVTMFSEELVIPDVPIELPEAPDAEAPSKEIPTRQGAARHSGLPPISAFNSTFPPLPSA